MDNHFLRPRLVGERFNQHSIPLELLKDFAALEEMIVELAKWQFKEAHPDRVRIPKGFTKGIELHIVDVCNGSAIPVIALLSTMNLSTANMDMFSHDESSNYFKQARDATIDAIACVGQDKPLPIPFEFLGYFDRFGRGLREGEYIEFLGKNGSTVRLTPDIRRRLIQASYAEAWTEEAVLKGRIPEADQSRMSFELELKDGTKLSAPLTGQHLKTVLEAFSGYRQGARVAVQCVAKKNRQNQLKTIELVEHITPLDPLDIESRLDELSELQAGWLDGRGIAPDRKNLLWFGSAFDERYSPALPLPYLYPTAEGGIQAEWPLKDWQVSLEINFVSKLADWQAANIITQECTDKTLDLNTNDGWHYINQELTKLYQMETHDA